IEFLLTTVGTSGFGGVNRGDVFVRLVDSKERSFSFLRLFRGLMVGQPRQAWQGNFTQQMKMAEIREALSGLSEIRASVRNLTSFRQGAPV
ncbi:hypothetical protein ACI3PL_22415, partial [Lacticaseibacillus paracasei]